MKVRKFKGEDKLINLQTFLHAQTGKRTVPFGGVLVPARSPDLGKAHGSLSDLGTRQARKRLGQTG